MGWFGFGSKKNKHEEPIDEAPIVDDSSYDDDWDDEDDSDDEPLSVYGCRTARTRITCSVTPRKNSKPLYKHQKETIHGQTS